MEKGKENPSSGSDSDDESQVEAPVEQQADSSDRKPTKIPKKLRTRYWSSWEDLLFVDLWRKYFDEITCLDKILPVFRKISGGMRESGFHITSQEVQRKIKSLKNKYIAERRRLNESEDKNAQSEWRLYPLVHCLFTPTQKQRDPFQEEKTLKTILERNRLDPVYHILLSGMPLGDTLNKLEAKELDAITPPIQFEDSFPAQNKKLSAHISFSYENKHKRSFTPRAQRPSEVAAARAIMVAGEKPTPNTRTESLTKQVQSMPVPLSNQTNTLNPVKCGMTLKSSATIESLKQIRLENRRLVDECVMDAKRLKMEEQQLKTFETLLEKMLERYENL